MHLQSYYLFRDQFGRPGKGNNKGKVEALGEDGTAPVFRADPGIAIYRAGHTFEQAEDWTGL